MLGNVLCALPGDGHDGILVSSGDMPVFSSDPKQEVSLTVLVSSGDWVA